MDWSVILNIILGGSLASCIAAMASLRSTVRKAGADAGRAEAEAESARLDNTEHATRILMEHIVSPLKDELNETRRQIELLKRSVSRLRKAIDTANSCRHHDDCPVLAGMRDEPKPQDRNIGRQPGSPRNQGRQHGGDDDQDRYLALPPEGDADDDGADGQPPPHP